MLTVLVKSVFKHIVQCRPPLVKDNKPSGDKLPLPKVVNDNNFVYDVCTSDSWR